MESDLHLVLLVHLALLVRHVVRVHIVFDDVCSPSSTGAMFSKYVSTKGHVVLLVLDLDLDVHFVLLE